jgi:hypothetical protein
MNRILRRRERKTQEELPQEWLMAKKLCPVLSFDKVGRRLLDRQLIQKRTNVKVLYEVLTPLAEQRRKNYFVVQF